MLTLLPLVSSSALVILSTLFAFSFAERMLRKAYGDTMYDASFHLHDISVYCAFAGLLCSMRFVCNIFVNGNISNLVSLVIILSAGYYLTFRGLLLAVFSKKFTETLTKRYGCHEKVCLDGSLARYHLSSAPAFVAQHMYSQISVSNRVAIPIGIVWVIFLFASSLYLPATMIQAFTVSSFLAVLGAIICSLILLPQIDTEKPLPPIKLVPLLWMLPSCIFLGSFITLTPLVLPNGFYSLLI